MNEANDPRTPTQREIHTVLGRKPALLGNNGLVLEGQKTRAEVERDAALLIEQSGGFRAGWIACGTFMDSVPGDSDDYIRIFGV